MTALRQLDVDLWEARSELRMPGGIRFPIRMTVVRLPDGRLLLHSPIAIDDALAAALAAEGEVGFIVAPNRLHHLFIQAAQQRYPAAETWAAPMLPAKRRDIRFSGRLVADPAPFAGALRPIAIDGVPWMGEVCFFHAATATLIVTDLFFNLRDISHLPTRWLFRLYGMYGNAKQSPLVRLATRDRAAAGQSARALLALPVRRLIPAHGEVVDVAAAETLQAVLARMASHAPPALPA